MLGQPQHLNSRIHYRVTEICKLLETLCLSREPSSSPSRSGLREKSTTFCSASSSTAVNFSTLSFENKIIWKIVVLKLYWNIFVSSRKAAKWTSKAKPKGNKEDAWNCECESNKVLENHLVKCVFVQQHFWWEPLKAKQQKITSRQNLFFPLRYKYNIY